MSLWGNILNAALPPRCPLSGEIVDVQGMLAPESWARLQFIADPVCGACGFPLEFSIESAGARCAACLKNPPVYGRGRSALVYDEASRDLILGFKHGDQMQSVVSFVPWFKRAGAELLEQTDILVPVPLHRWRLLRRRYNQAALMAQALGKAVGKPCLPDILQRVRATPIQGYMRPRERQKNVKNAFRLYPRHTEKIVGKNILLIDDVYTTGSTVSECVKTLLAGGAGHVDVLTLARVVRSARLD